MQLATIQYSIIKNTTHVPVEEGAVEEGTSPFSAQASKATVGQIFWMVEVASSRSWYVLSIMDVRANG